MFAPPHNPRAYMNNDLVRSPLRLNHMEARILALALGCVHSSDEELPSISVRMGDILPYQGGGTVYKIVKDALDGLTSKPLSIDTETFYTRLPIFKVLSLEKRTGIVTGKFNDELTPLFLRLKRYTVMQIETLLTLKTSHGHRLCWLLKSWEPQKGKGETTHRFGFEELRALFLGTESVTYPLWTDFKRYVLDPATSELCDHLKWYVSFEEEKEGRKVAAVVFTIPPFPTQGDEPVVRTQLDAGEVEQFRAWLQKTYGDKWLEQYNRLFSDKLPFQLEEYQARTVIKVVKTDEDLAKLTKVLHKVATDFSNHIKITKTNAAYTLFHIKKVLPVKFPKAK